MEYKLEYLVDDEHKVFFLTKDERGHRQASGK